MRPVQPRLRHPALRAAAARRAQMMLRTPKLRCKSEQPAQGSSRRSLRTPASAGHPSQSSSGRDSGGGAVSVGRGNGVGPREAVNAQSHSDIHWDDIREGDRAAAAGVDGWGSPGMRRAPSIPQCVLGLVRPARCSRPGWRVHTVHEAAVQDGAMNSRYGAPGSVGIPRKRGTERGLCLDLSKTM